MKDDILKFENEKEIFYSKMMVEREKIEIQNFELMRREENLKMGIKDLKTATGNISFLNSIERFSISYDVKLRFVGVRLS